MNNTSLDALFSGLTKNEPTEKQETPPQPEPPVIKKSVEQGTAREKQKEKERAKSDERFCTIVSSELLKKIRIIAKREGLPIKDIVSAAFEKAIDLYEQKHGEVFENQKKNAKELF